MKHKRSKSKSLPEKKPSKPKWSGSWKYSHGEWKKGDIVVDKFTGIVYRISHFVSQRKTFNYDTVMEGGFTVPAHLFRRASPIEAISYRAKNL